MNDDVAKMHPKSELVLVDDDKLTLEIVSWNLRKTAYVAHVFPDPEQALIHLASSIPQLLVVDFYMPKMTGIEFLERADQVCGLHNTAIYLCSALMQGREILASTGKRDIQQLDKKNVCDRSLLLALLEKHLR